MRVLPTGTARPAVGPGIPAILAIGSACARVGQAAIEFRRVAARATGALTTIIRQVSLAPDAAIEANTRSVRKSKLLNTEPGTQVQLYRCHGYASNGAPQRWVFVQAEDRNGNPVMEGGNNVYELYNLAAGRCLAVTATRVAQPLILTSCVTTSTSVALWELRPTTPASHDFQLALWLYDDWCIGANDFNDNSPTRLLLFGCSPSDTSQLWNLG